MSSMGRGMQEVFDDFLVSAASDDENLVVLHSDAASSMIPAFRGAYGSRCFNMGMAELDLISTAAGMAAAGKKPWILSTASRLLGRGYDAIRTAIALPRLPVKIATVYGGVASGEDGAVSQLLEDIALMRSLAGMSVIVPSDAVSALVAMREVSKSNGPVYLRLSGVPMPDIYSEGILSDSINGALPLSFGEGVTICSCGIMVHEALKASSVLAQQDITAEILDCRSVVPIPERAILESVHRTGCCVVAEEHSARGGLGEAVASVLCRNYPVPVRFVSVNDMGGQSGSPRELLEYYGLTHQQIVGAAVEVWTMRRR